MGFYIIKKNDKYFSSGGGYVNSSGLFDTHQWIASQSQAFGTGCLEHAQDIANRYGGKPVLYPDTEQQSSIADLLNTTTQPPTKRRSAADLLKLLLED